MPVCSRAAGRGPPRGAGLGSRAGLAVTLPPVAVWLGATLALITTSVLGIWLGVTLLRRIPIHRLHQVRGVFFLVLAAFAANFIAKLIHKHRWVAWIGLLIIAYVAVDMIVRGMMQVAAAMS